MYNVYISIYMAFFDFDGVIKSVIKPKRTVGSHTLVLIEIGKISEDISS